MFTESAEFYDLIYSWKDYPAEAARVAALIRELHPQATRVLDVACGTGEHARILEAEHGFVVDGLDVNEAFVAVAAGKLGAGRVYRGDMTSFELPARYDVILCLFSSIGYVRTLDNVRRTLECFRRHLAPDGVVILEPWLAPDAVTPGRVTVHSSDRDGIAVVRMSYMSVEGSMSRLHFEYLIGRPTGIGRLTEIHEMGLFTVEEMLACFAGAGFAASWEPEGLTGRGLYTGR